MTSIIGYADLIRGGPLDEEERRQAANFIFTEGRRLEALAAEWAPVYEEQGVSLFYRAEDGACLLEPELVKTLP